MTRHAGCLLDRGHRRCQRVAIVRIALAKLDADNPVAAIGRGNGHFLAKLITLSRLALADAFYLGFVETVELVLVTWILGAQAFALGKQRLQGLVRLGKFAAKVANHST